MTEETTRPVQADCEVSAIQKLADRLYTLEINAPELAVRACPGQFVHIACGEGNFLRRPISICDVAGGSLRLVFQAKGQGTQWLSTRAPGDTLDVLGTLGNGFRLSGIGARPVFVGGGIGVPPLLLAMKAAKAQGAEPAAILGFRSKSMVILEEEFRALGTVEIATDDGSYGTHGFVTNLFKQRCQGFTAVCACGPKDMLRAVAACAGEAGLPCQVSMEERMGCGIGACLVCACALKDENGGTYYGHVCKNGPVFDAKDVVWES